MRDGWMTDSTRYRVCRSVSSRATSCHETAQLRGSSTQARQLSRGDVGNRTMRRHPRGGVVAPDSRHRVAS